MQDRFKFRVWLKNEKRYGYLLNLFNCGANSQYEVEEYDEQGNHYTVYSADEVVLQQCTGLKDKNGKLIFEGDITTYDSRDLFPHTTVKTGEIEWYKSHWVMSYYDKNMVNANTQKPSLQHLWLGSDDFIQSRLEVIGNIYKNPELLESEV